MLVAIVAVPLRGRIRVGVLVLIDRLRCDRSGTLVQHLPSHGVADPASQGQQQDEHKEQPMAHESIIR
jgi:hypothetical protein